MEPVKITTRLPQDVWERVSREAELRQISKQDVIIAKLREPSGITELTMTEKLDRLMSAVESLQVKVDNHQCQPLPANTSQLPASTIKTLTKEEFTAQYHRRFWSGSKFNETFYNKVVRICTSHYWVAPDARRWALIAPDLWCEVLVPSNAGRER